MEVPSPGHMASNHGCEITIYLYTPPRQNQSLQRSSQLNQKYKPPVEILLEVQHIRVQWKGVQTTTYKVVQWGPARH